MTTHRPTAIVAPALLCKRIRPACTHSLRRLAALFALALGCALAAPSSHALTPEEATHVGGDLKHAGAKLATLQEATGKVIDIAPSTLGELSDAVNRIVDSRGPRTGTHNAWLALLSLAIVGALMLAYRRATAKMRQKRLQDPLHARGAAGLMALDIGYWAVMAASAYVLVEILFHGDHHQSLMMVAILWAFVRWRLFVLLLDIVLRPRLPAYRLIAMSDGAALQVKWIIALATLAGIFGISVMPVLLRAGLPIPAGQVIVLVQGVIVAAGGLLALWRYKASHVATGTARTLTVRIWVGFGAAAIAATWFAWSISVLLLEFSIFHSLVATLRIAGLAYVLDMLLGLSSHSTRVQFLQRSITAAAALAIGIVTAQVWLVDELEILTSAQWAPIRRSLISAAVTLFVGYVGWRYLHHWTEKRLRAASAGIGPESDDEAIEPASRLTTALPMLRILAGITILVVAALLALSQLGVEITPLLAGAGVFGLAISFGSQALVRDIVSGIFFMFDDAFRVGEYIDTGRLKGTVERISLRSVRLRHQNGQVHTIPYGQLTSITNFSRDWQTVKFNLRLARDADIEKVRKTAKKVGLELKADPDFGKELILPLKMQGVAEIADTALVVRFKFTVKPSNPSWVQREYLKRLYRAFEAEGIAFASGAITVQNADGSTPPQTAIAAAAGAAAAEAATQAGSRSP